MVPENVSEIALGRQRPLVSLPEDTVYPAGKGDLRFERSGHVRKLHTFVGQLRS